LNFRKRESATKYFTQNNRLPGRFFVGPKGGDPMSIGSNYTGANSQTLAIKQSELQLYLGAQTAFASGAQEYKIGNREMKYTEPQALQSMINQLMLEIVMLQNSGRRRSFAVIPRDL
jgi:hypothetical protein